MGIAANMPAICVILASAVSLAVVIWSSAVASENVSAEEGAAEEGEEGVQET